MTSKDLQICDSTEDYFEFRKVLFSRDEHVIHLTCGSFFEIPLLYFLSNPTDIDLMYCDMSLCAMHSHAKVPAWLARNVLIIDTKDCHIGYARLRYGAEYIRKYKHDIEEGPAFTNPISVETSCLRALLGMVYHRWGNISKIGRDNVYSISCPLWPQDAHEWISRKRINGWPPTETINAIAKSGFHLVSKAHGRNPNDDTQWRYSFSAAEAILIHNKWTDVQKYIYHLLRIIKTDVVSKWEGKDKAFLSSYYVKTLMLWACEEKPSKFWKEANIVTSVRELLLNLIEKLMERNMPHYFVSVINIMCGLSHNIIGNAICSLVSYTEDKIFELMRIEPKAYKMTPGFIVIPNQGLYPLLAMHQLYHFVDLLEIKIDNRQLEELKEFRICSSNYFFPELEYLDKAILIHLQLSTLNKYQNQKRREELITSAEDLFNLSIQKLDYGFTRFRFHLGWSITEFFQQHWRLCGGEHFSRLRTCRPMPMTSCYVRDEEYYLRNHCSIAPGSMEKSKLPILQKIIMKEITLPFNSTYFLCSAYKANFFCNALCNYRKALEVCTEAKEELNCLSDLHRILFVELLPFPLRYEWCGLYDKYIQILLGFIAL